MDPGAISILAGVVVGYALGAGTQPRIITKALGAANLDRLLGLLELLEDPRDPASRTRSTDAT